MQATEPLKAHLLDLLFELREHSIPITVGGGFGLCSTGLPPERMLPCRPCPAILIGAGEPLEPGGRACYGSNFSVAEGGYFPMK